MQRACVCACVRVLRCSRLLPDSQPVPPSDAGGESSSFPLRSSLSLTRFHFSRVAQRGTVTQQSITVVWSRPALPARYREEKRRRGLCGYSSFAREVPITTIVRGRPGNDIVGFQRPHQKSTVVQTCSRTSIFSLQASVLGLQFTRTTMSWLNKAAVNCLISPAPISVSSQATLTLPWTLWFCKLLIFLPLQLLKIDFFPSLLDTNSGGFLLFVPILHQY